MDIDVKACFDYIQLNAQNLGKAKAEIIRLEAKVKSVKAVLMDASDATSIAMKEAWANQHSGYIAAIQELADATAEETRLGILIKAAFQKIETHRAMTYLARQEMKNLQGP